MGKLFADVSKKVALAKIFVLPNCLKIRINYVFFCKKRLSITR